MAEMKSGSYPLAIVTGAAKRIGRAIALELARKGYAIGLHYHHSEEEATAARSEIEAAGGAVVMLRADLCEEGEIAAMFREIDRSGLELRVLVNSAAVMPRGDLRTMSASEWDGTLALNLRAPWLCAREAALRMKPGSLIINISDTGAGKVWTGYPAYTISKAGLETLTRLLAKTLAPAVRVNAIAPGLILKGEDLSEEEWLRLAHRLPLKAPGSIESLIKAVNFLLENTYVTGQCITVDGGYALI